VTGGNGNGIIQMEYLRQDKAAGKLIADKGYDSDAFRTMLAEKESKPLSHPRKRSNPVSCAEQSCTEHFSSRTSS